MKNPENLKLQPMPKKVEDKTDKKDTEPRKISLIKLVNKKSEG